MRGGREGEGEEGRGEGRKGGGRRRMREGYMYYSNCYKITVFLLFLVVKTTVFLADMNDYQRVNEVYSTCEFLIILR